MIISSPLSYKMPVQKDIKQPLPMAQQSAPQQSTMNYTLPGADLVPYMKPVNVSFNGFLGGLFGKDSDRKPLSFKEKDNLISLGKKYDLLSTRGIKEVRQLEKQYEQAQLEYNIARGAQELKDYNTPNYYRIYVQPDRTIVVDEDGNESKYPDALKIKYYRDDREFWFPPTSRVNGDSGYLFVRAHHRDHIRDTKTGFDFTFYEFPDRLKEQGKDPDSVYETLMNAYEKKVEEVLTVLPKTLASGDILFSELDQKTLKTVVDQAGKDTSTLNIETKGISVIDLVALETNVADAIEDSNSLLGDMSQNNERLFDLNEFMAAGKEMSRVKDISSLAQKVEENDISQEALFDYVDGHTLLTNASFENINTLERFADDVYKYTKVKQDALKTERAVRSVHVKW